MDLKEVFHKIMNETDNIVLSTSNDGQPNARVVTFAYDQNKEGVLYFTTFPGNKKITEFEKNDKVCFLPLYKDGYAQSQIRVSGIIKKSQCTVNEIAPLILKKVPNFKELIDRAGDVLLVYEINFKSVEVTVGMSPSEIIKL